MRKSFKELNELIATPDRTNQTATDEQRLRIVELTEALASDVIEADKLDINWITEKNREAVTDTLAV